MLCHQLSKKTIRNACAISSVATLSERLSPPQPTAWTPIGDENQQSRSLEPVHHKHRATGRAEVAQLGSSEIGYSFRVRRVLGAGSRSALPLRFSVYSSTEGRFREDATSHVPSCFSPSSIPACQRIRCRSGPGRKIAVSQADALV